MKPDPTLFFPPTELSPSGVTSPGRLVRINFKIFLVFKFVFLRSFHWPLSQCECLTVSSVRTSRAWIIKYLNKSLILQFILRSFTWKVNKWWLFVYKLEKGKSRFASKHINSSSCSLSLWPISAEDTLLSHHTPQLAVWITHEPLCLLPLLFPFPQLSPLPLLFYFDILPLQPFLLWPTLSHPLPPSLLSLDLCSSLFTILLVPVVKEVWLPTVCRHSFFQTRIRHPGIGCMPRSSRASCLLPVAFPCCLSLPPPVSLLIVRHRCKRSLGCGSAVDQHFLLCTVTGAWLTH